LDARSDMIDTQRLGALLRALVRDDAQNARLRTPATMAVRATAGVGPEVDSPDPQLARAQAHLAAQAARAMSAAGTASAACAEVAVERDGTATREASRDSAAPRNASRDAAVRASGDNARAAPGGVDARAPASAALQLSDTARLLLAALRTEGTPLDAVTVPRSAMHPVLAARDDAQEASSSSASTARARPLVAVPPHSEYATDRLALQLKDTVEFSGVFYESHLAQWADDLRPRALLAHEPQARWPVAADIAQSAAAPPNAPADFATPVLRQQLEVLDTGRFMWSGELWPGQRGALLIEEDEPSRRHDEPLRAMRTARWRVRLTLDFAHLGAIEASLLLAGDSLDLGLRCDGAEVAAQLRAAAPTLRAAIAERALDLDQMTISDGRPA
jgi:flagellar hook-length control protein FliK